jgi:hypothetical protein
VDVEGGICISAGDSRDDSDDDAEVDDARTQSGAMTSDMEDGECVDCSTCAILKRVSSLAVVRPCLETRRGVDEAAVEETMPVSCETSF